MRITEIFSLGRDDRDHGDGRWYDDGWRNRHHDSWDWDHRNWDDWGHNSWGNC